MFRQQLTGTYCAAKLAWADPAGRGPMLSLFFFWPVSAKECFQTGSSTGNP